MLPGPSWLQLKAFGEFDGDKLFNLICLFASSRQLSGMLLLGYALCSKYHNIALSG